MSAIPEYRYYNANAGWAHSYLLDSVLDEVKKTNARRAFEIGAGSGYVASRLAAMGLEVIAIEPSASGVALAKEHYPNIRFEMGSVYDDLVPKYARFPLVLSLEVVEHLMEPRKFARAVYELLEDDGIAIVSTPYHGYLKNLALAVTGKMDAHFTALWDGGHVKFWSIATLTRLVEEAGLRVVRVIRVGRLPPFAKSMIFVLTRAKST